MAFQKEIPRAMQSRTGEILERPRLHGLLDRLPSARYAVITAPGGWGKSVLVRDWAEHHPEVSTPWLDLTRADNDPTRFWRRILSAVSAAADLDLTRANAALGAGRQGELLHAIDRLTDKLGEMATPLVLVLDDFHTISESTVFETIEYFGDSAPPTLAMALISRRDLPLDLARRRVTDGLVEIRERDLRFTEEETREVTSAAGPDWSDAATTRLHEATAGWPVAVRLAVLSRADPWDPPDEFDSYGQAGQALADFFAQEVLAGASTQVRSFLLTTSILDEMNVSLAEAVSGSDEVQALRRDPGVRSVLNVEPFESETFRYHHLFQRLLRLELEQISSEQDLAELHRRAAAWHYANHGADAAIAHAIAAGDHEEATQWLAELSATLMATGEAATLLDLSRQLIDAVEHPTNLQLVCKGEALHGLGTQSDEFDRILATIEERLLESAASDETDQWVTGAADPRSWDSPKTLPWLRAVRYRRKGQAAELLELDVPGNVPSPAAVLEGEIAEGMIWLEQYTRAEELLGQSMARANADGYVVHTIHYLGLLAAIRAGSAQMQEARAITDRALALCAEHELGLLRHTMYARLVDIQLLMNARDLEDAESRAVSLQIFSEQAGDVPLATQQAMLRANIRWSLGDRTGARALLDEASTIATGWPVGGHFHDRLVQAQARYDLLEGDVTAAQLRLPDWRERLEASSRTVREWLLFRRLAVETDVGSVALDEPPPSPLEPTALHHMEWRRIRARALDLSNESEAATKELAQALQMAQRIDQLQPILDERAVLGGLLPRAAEAAGVDALGLAPSDDADTPRPVFVEPMTGREQAVLVQMATHLSYPEIAGELHLSLNTVKSHCKAIFRKLAVTKRADAVARARSYGLIR